ncbi:unnamed protein product [Sphenostylis stenocarpa]|uniref:Uncharacterized protein n=1 Tax=Sphenostylis stenocarpa TaxID=92480 RepID=A0AA86RPJ4_9FABA|nr:unnamed protein product [Sphenostylis stenocarpa]
MSRMYNYGRVCATGLMLRNNSLELFAGGKLGLRKERERERERERATGINLETKGIDINDRDESKIKEIEISACVKVPVERLLAPKPTSPPPRSTNTLFTEADWEVLRQNRNERK